MTVAVDIWMLDLTRIVDESSLNAAERERAERLRLPEKRRQFAAARVGLREILSRVTGREPASLEFQTAEHGKPSLAALPDAPHFNLAHSGDLALVAVAAVPVGVDVERVRPLPNMAQMADMSMSAGEQAALHALPDDQRIDAFFRLWTRKEAVMKADGAGFRLAKAFTLPGPTYDGAVSVGGTRYVVQGVETRPNFLAAVAIRYIEATDIAMRLHA